MAHRLSDLDEAELGDLGVSLPNGNSHTPLQTLNETKPNQIAMT
jgi:hypothetical protein